MSNMSLQDCIITCKKKPVKLKLKIILLTFVVCFPNKVVNFNVDLTLLDVFSLMKDHNLLVHKNFYLKVLHDILLVYHKSKCYSHHFKIYSIFKYIIVTVFNCYAILFNIFLKFSKFACNFFIITYEIHI